MSSVKYYDPLLERFKEKSRQRKYASILPFSD